eukprot:CAMPEP_0201512166 /NCGR_PEP_ID=MMETSP0161_2-20130828/4472_1 /ASSEMBLY_ACC=CAM_ASM_000251 /TAXON_ID=180227 /ORGANISM="Neoparamoeba aestuarina, Strain SoJaBio B1-5/56/2" /LENGTH=507 /DNA_ID=CAMNT_0047907909 /DNA_START=109 /DNA_END=1632 /DNA_ORIENTATION=-
MSHSPNPPWPGSPPPNDDDLRFSMGSPFGEFDGLRGSFFEVQGGEEFYYEQSGNQTPQQGGDPRWGIPENLMITPPSHAPVRVKSEFGDVRVKSECFDNGLRASPIVDCSGVGNENCPPPPPFVKEERGNGHLREFGAPVKSEFVHQPLVSCGYGAEPVDHDIAVEFYKGPWSDFFGATDKCSWQASCLQGEKVRWSHQRTFQTGVLLRRKSTGKYIRPRLLSRVFVNQQLIVQCGETTVNPSSLASATEFHFRVHFLDEGGKDRVAGFVMAFESESSPGMRGLLNFGAPLPREWYKQHVPISHLPYFSFPSKTVLGQAIGYLEQQQQHDAIQPGSMGGIRQGIYFTLQFGEIDKILPQERSFRLVVYQPTGEKYGEPTDQIRLHLLSRLPKPATVEMLRKQRKEQMQEYLEECFGKSETKKGRSGKKRDWLDDSKRQEARDLKKAEKTLKKFASKLKEQYPEEFPECEKSTKALCEAMKKEGGAKGGMSPEALRHAVLVMALNYQF